MLNVVAALFVVFGLIGLFSLILRYLHTKGKFTPWLNSSQQDMVIEQTTPLQHKRNLVTLIHKGQRYTLLYGPHNDVLLDTSSVVHQVIEQKDRRHA